MQYFEDLKPNELRFVKTQVAPGTAGQYMRCTGTRPDGEQCRRVQNSANGRQGLDLPDIVVY
jgi:hypothetical protein